MNKNVQIIPARRQKPIVKDVGIYCRVSSSKKDQLNSLSAQISALTKQISYVDQWQLVDTFIDVASAKGDQPRREFDRMLAACETHQISVIVTKSISRFGRDTVETLEALRRLRTAGVQVVFQQENIDTERESDELIISIIEAIAQAENESRSANIRIGLERKAALGKTGNIYRKVYGYRKNASGNLEVDEEQAKVVRNIFRWYLDGDSVLGIISRLNEAGIPSPQGKEKWSKAAIENILSKRKYTGTVDCKSSLNEGAIYRISDCVPPIITESEYRAVEDARLIRSNVEIDDEGVAHRKSTKYSSKKRKNKERNDELL